MKRHHIYALIAGCLIIASIAFAQLDRNFWLGLLAGAALFLGLTATIGQSLAQKHRERMDKWLRDAVEDRDY